MNIHLHIANVNVTVQDDTQLKHIVDILNKHSGILKTIVMTNEELLAKLEAANTKADKIIAEVTALKELVGTTPDVPQNIVDAVTALEAKLQTADDLNEDAATA